MAEDVRLSAIHQLSRQLKNKTESTHNKTFESPVSMSFKFMWEMPRVMQNSLLANLWMDRFELIYGSTSQEELYKHFLTITIMPCFSLKYTRLAFMNTNNLHSLLVN